MTPHHTTAATGATWATWDDLDPRTLHDLVSLRIDVFVVEQACAYRELDGRDLDPRTEHVWTSDTAGPSAYLRVLADADGSPEDADGPIPGVRIGRVCTRADARGQGLARLLIDEVLARYGDRPVRLEAQAHLSTWYARFGFTPSGPQYLDDDIPHVPMLRPAAAGGDPA